MKMEKFIQIVNIPYHITSHVVGENHTRRHRRIVGFIVMFVGVSFAHMADHLSNMLISLFGDLIGYGIHSTRLIPFIHDIEKGNKPNPEQETEQNCQTC